MSERMTINYQMRGDQQYPVLEEKLVIAEYGIYGNMRRNYLEKNNPSLFLRHLVNGTLEQHCQTIDRQAEELESRILKGLIGKLKIDENLKETDPVSWARQMNAAREAAREVVKTQIIYV